MPQYKKIANFLSASGKHSRFQLYSTGPGSLATGLRFRGSKIVMCLYFIVNYNYSTPLSDNPPAFINIFINIIKNIFKCRFAQLTKKSTSGREFIISPDCCFLYPAIFFKDFFISSLTTSL